MYITYPRVNCLKPYPLGQHIPIKPIYGSNLPPPRLSLRINKKKINIYKLKESAANIENTNIQLPGLLSSCEERRVLEWSTRLVLKKQQKQTIVSQSIGKEFNSHSTGLGHQHGRRFIREFKQQWRQQRRKLHLKREVAVSNFIALMRSRSFRKMLADFSGPVVQPLDNALHQIKIYPVDNAIGGFPSNYPLDSDWSSG